MKIKLQHGSQEVVESVENGANYFSNKAKKKSKKCWRSCQQYQKSSKSNEMELVKQDGLCIHNL